MSWSFNYLTRLQKEIQGYKEQMMMAINLETAIGRQGNLVKLSQELDNLIFSYQNYSRILDSYQNEPFTVDFYMNTSVKQVVNSAVCQSGSSIWLANDTLKESGSDYIIIVNSSGESIGSLTKDELKEICCQKTLDTNSLKELKSIQTVFDTVPVSTFILDEELFIEYANTEAIRNFSGLLPANFLFKKAALIFSGMFSRDYQEFIESAFWAYISNYKCATGVEVRLLNYISLMANIKSAKDNNGRRNIIISFFNVEDLKHRVEELTLTSEELTQALGLFLPHHVEKELRKIPEYKDIYNYDTEKITIVSRIKDGGYWHVINCLRILSQIDRLGIFERYRIDKNLLVQAIIVHDIGKNQPSLDIGDTVDPKNSFELGKLHAKRSALYCKQNGYTKAAIALVKYHHHDESEVPKNWTPKFMLTFRIFKLIDGLSAAITRRNAVISYKLIDDFLVIYEENKERPEYSQKYTLFLKQERKYSK